MIYEKTESKKKALMNMPTEVWLADVFNKKKKKLWPKN